MGESENQSASAWRNRPFSSSISFVSPAFLSLVIPAYNEERRLAASLVKVLAFFDKQPYASEAIIVDNGSTDRTQQLAFEMSRRQPEKVKAIREPLKGKGAAVRAGVAATTGRYVAFSDCDLSVPIGELNRFLPMMEDYDIAIASREAPGSHRHEEPYYRHLMGRVFNLLVRALVLPGFHDAQCGFKCFRRSAALELFGKQTIVGWAFDVEILTMARSKGYRIVELAVPWYFDPDTRISPVTDALRMVREVWNIRRLRRKGFYDGETILPSGDEEKSLGRTGTVPEERVISTEGGRKQESHAN